MEELVDACHDRQGDESRVQDRVRLIRRAVFTSDSCSVTEGLVFRCQCACMSHQSPPGHDGSWRSGTHSANHVPERIWYEQIGLRRGIYGLAITKRPAGYERPATFTDSCGHLDEHLGSAPGHLERHLQPSADVDGRTGLERHGV